MKTGDKVGFTALMLLAISIGIGLTKPQTNAVFAAGLILPGVAVVLLIYAGIRGSRWWFALPPFIYVIFELVIARGV